MQVTSLLPELLTQQDENEYAVSYSSSKLTTTAQNWSITEKKCCSVVRAFTEVYSSFLLGAAYPPTIITDHAALKWLLTSSSLRNKLARWQARLAEYQPLII